MAIHFEFQPRLFRQLIVSGLGVRNRFLRYRGDFIQTTKFLRESDRWRYVQKYNWQRERLVRLVESACSGTGYYRLAFRNLDFKELTEATLFDSLAMLPVLEKETLRTDLESLLNENYSRFSESSTSGSTGSPIRVEHDLHSIQRRFAVQANHVREAGANILEPSVRLSGRLLAPVGQQVTKPWLYNVGERQLFISSYHLDESHAEAICKRVERLGPKVIDGYPSAILQLCRILARVPATLSSVNLIITTAETLQPEVKEELQSFIRGSVLDYYSASEGLPIVQQCCKGTYHVRWQSGILEVQTGSGIKPEGDGEIVATSFVQDRTPLIRYRTGDLVSGLRQINPAACPCGLITPTVEGVLGRVEDLIYLPDGRTLGMFTYRTLKYVKGLQESQVVQQDYAKFLLRAVLAPSADERAVSLAVNESFERALGYEIRLDTEFVSSLPRGPNGKVRLVSSHVPKAMSREGSKDI